MPRLKKKITHLSKAFRANGSGKVQKVQGKPKDVVKGKEVVMCQELYEIIRNHKTEQGRLLCESFIRASNQSSLAENSDIATSPIDILKIEQKLNSNEYIDFQQFASDVELMVNNAKSYCEENSQEYQDACELWKVFSDATIHKKEAKSREIDDVSKLKNRTVKLYKKKKSSWVKIRQRRESARIKSLKKTAEERERTFSHYRTSTLNSRSRISKSKAHHPDLSTPQEAATLRKLAAKEKRTNIPMEKICQIMKHNGPQFKLQWLLYETVKKFINSKKHKLSEFFWKLPSVSYYPDYYKEVKRPITLFTIERKIKECQYACPVEVVADMNRMFKYAKMYNMSDSKLFEDAVVIEKVMKDKTRKLIDSHVKMGGHIVRQPVVNPAPPAAPIQIQLIQGPNGQLLVTGLLPGQHLIRLADGRLQLLTLPTVQQMPQTAVQVTPPMPTQVQIPTLQPTISLAPAPTMTTGPAIATLTTSTAAPMSVPTVASITAPDTIQLLPQGPPTQINFQSPVSLTGATATTTPTTSKVIQIRPLAPRVQAQRTVRPLSPGVQQEVCLPTAVKIEQLGTEVQPGATTQQLATGQTQAGSQTSNSQRLAKSQVVLKSVVDRVEKEEKNTPRKQKCKEAAEKRNVKVVTTKLQTFLLRDTKLLRRDILKKKSEKMEKEIQVKIQESSQEYQDACELRKFFLKKYMDNSDHAAREKEKRRSYPTIVKISKSLETKKCQIKNPIVKKPIDTQSKLQWLLYETIKNFIKSEKPKLSEFFWKLPSLSYYPDYYKEIQEPISLITIRRKIEQCQYSSPVKVVADMNLMFKYAKMYNMLKPKLFKDAVMLEKVMKAKTRELINSHMKTFHEESSFNSSSELALVELKFYVDQDENTTEQDEAQAQLLRESMLRSPAGLLEGSTSESSDNLMHECLLDNGDQSQSHSIVQSQVPQVASIKQEYILPDDGPNPPFINSLSDEVFDEVEMKFYVDQDEVITEPASKPSDTSYTTLDATERIATTPEALDHGQTCVQSSNDQLSTSRRMDLNTTYGSLPIDLNLIKKEPVDLNLVKKEVDDT